MCICVVCMLALGIACIRPFAKDNTEMPVTETATPAPTDIFAPTPEPTMPLTITRVPQIEPSEDRVDIFNVDDEIEAYLRLKWFESNLTEIVGVRVNGVSYILGLVDGEWILLEVAYG